MLLVLNRGFSRSAAGPPLPLLSADWLACENNAVLSAETGDPLLCDLLPAEGLLCEDGRILGQENGDDLLPDLPPAEGLLAEDFAILLTETADLLSLET